MAAILHKVQEEDKELDMESQRYIAQLLRVPFVNIYGLVTFYRAFSTSEKGEASWHRRYLFNL